MEIIQTIKHQGKKKIGKQENPRQQAEDQNQDMINQDTRAQKCSVMINIQDSVMTNRIRHTLHA